MYELELFIKENWGIIPLTELSETNNLKKVLEIAFNSQLYKIATPNIGRRWTEQEDEFLKEFAKFLSVKEASNLLYRSHYATYQRVRLLNLGSLMINKKSKDD